MRKHIAEQVKRRMVEQDLSIFKLAGNLDGVGPAQVHRVVRGQNYTIDTLIKILEYLNLELTLSDERCSLGENNDYI